MTKLPEVGKIYRRNKYNLDPKLKSVPYDIKVVNVRKERFSLNCADVVDVADPELNILATVTLENFWLHYEEVRDAVSVGGVELNEFHALMDRMCATRLTIDCEDGTKFVISQGGIEISNNKK